MEAQLSEFYKPEWFYVNPIKKLNINASRSNKPRDVNKL